VGGRDGAGGQAEAAGGSTDRRETTREERKLMAAVQISQQLEKDRQRKQDQASKGKKVAQKRLAADDSAVRVSNDTADAATAVRVRNDTAGTARRPTQREQAPPRRRSRSESA
jgi:hypothetical protein